MNDSTFPTEEEIDYLLDKLMPANEDMDSSSAALILDRQGIDRAHLAAALKTRLERRVARMKQKGEVIPPELLRLVKSL